MCSTINQAAPTAQSPRNEKTLTHQADKNFERNRSAEVVVAANFIPVSYGSDREGVTRTGNRVDGWGSTVNSGVES